MQENNFINQNNPIGADNPLNTFDNTQVNNNFNSGNYPNDDYGPRPLSLFTLFAKTFLGFAGGIIGSLVLLLIFLVASSILQPVLNPASTSTETINPIFIVILMAMIFATTLITSIITPWLLSYTEKLRYPRLNTAIYQIFIINLIIFAFTAPIYLTTSTTSIEFTAYAAGLQVILVSTASALILEILNDQKYPLLGVYTSIIGILIATAVNLFIFKLFKSPTVLLFASLPIIWGSIGFFQASLAMVYHWYYINWGNDFLASNASFGIDYAGTQREVYQEELEQQQETEDKIGSDFFKS